MSAAEAGDIEPLLEYLKTQRGFDFTGYKRSTLGRRIARRMEAVGAGTYEAYIDHLEVHQDEFPHLFDSILINVTAFFRDGEAWDTLAAEVLPDLLAAKGPDQPIRVWCAGCSSGEEPYTAAIVLAEALGIPAYCERVKIYATDADDRALDEARHAVYGPKAVADIDPRLVDRYFEAADGQYAFRKDLRRTVIFGRNDLVQDAPISRVDLLLCRNTLMYFNAETQAHILGRFHFALNPDGVLFVGKSEMLITHAHLFEPVNLKRRVFRKVASTTLRDRLLTTLPAIQAPQAVEAPLVTEADRLRDLALECAPVGQLLVDRDGVLQHANQSARDLLGVRDVDVGRPIAQLDVAYRPVELRSHLDRVQHERRGGTVEGAPLSAPGGTPRFVDVRVAPLVLGDELLGASVTFVDVTGRQRLRAELEQSQRDLEHSYEELQSTVEELETTNEELQSTNEELETTNEELQSTNEELETMNEELQSTNEELETMNDELRLRTAELNEVNRFLETILTSMRLSVAVLDRSLRVRIWNAQSEQIWGMRPDEAEGEFFLGLDIGLPVERLKQPLRATLDGALERHELVLEARNRRGRGFACEVTLMPMRTADEITGAIVVMQEPLRDDGDGAARSGGAHAGDAA